MPTIDGKIVPLLYFRYTDDFVQFEWGKECDYPGQISTLLDAVVQEAGAKGMTVVARVALVPTESLYPPETDGTAVMPTEKEPES